jgi:hypothetical protein
MTEALKAGVARLAAEVGGKPIAGTAFLVGQRRALTCAHCLGDKEYFASHAQLHFSRWPESDRDVGARLLQIDWDLDSALLELERDAPVGPMPLAAGAPPGPPGRSSATPPRLPKTASSSPAPSSMPTPVRGESPCCSSAATTPTIASSALREARLPSTGTSSLC